MATDCITQVAFEFEKRVVAKFDAAHTSTDGGAVLLKALDRQLGVTTAVASCLRDQRQPGKVQHELVELVQQRIFGLVCGYADCNDAARLVDDPIHKWLLDRDPLIGPPLASQATLSRFENAVGPLALTRLGHALADLVIGQHHARRQGRARRITIDLDPTDDPTHGQQEFAFFNGHYDTACYLPLLGFVTFDDEPEQYLVLALLRPGTSAAKRGAIGRLRTLFRNCGPPSPGCGCACAWTAASPARSWWPSWKRRAWSTRSRSAAIGDWRSAPSGSWAASACARRPRARPSTSSARRGTPRKPGRASDGSS